ncbi:hypothetical protein THOM_1408, partial [Trachipleistophora hominis]
VIVPFLVVLSIVTYFDGRIIIEESFIFFAVSLFYRVGDFNSSIFRRNVFVHDDL